MQCEIKIQDTQLTQQVSYPTGILIKGSKKSSLNHSEVLSFEVLLQSVFLYIWQEIFSKDH